LYRAADKIENVHLSDEGHDYGPSKREAMYKFMARRLHLNFKNATTADGRIDEAGTILDPDLITVFTPEHPRPAYALKDTNEIAAALRKAQRKEFASRNRQ